MRIPDPREWGLHHPWWTTVVFLGLTTLFVCGNLRVERGGILDEGVIVQEQDPVRRMDQYVHQKVEEGFEGREFISFVVNRDIRTPAALQQIAQLTEAAKQTFGDTVVSLATVPAYKDTGEALDDTPYITLGEVARPDFAIHEWQAQVAQDPGVFGLLVGRNFSWASVVRYLPPGYDEIAEFRKTVEFLEGRTIPWWEWLWKKDIVPHHPAIGVGGWTMGRGLVDQGLNVDILTLVFLGVLLTVPVFRAALGSWRAACLGVGVMVIGAFVWTRGAMGWIGVPERVFSLLAYASVIVQGTSFALHKFTALAESEGQGRVVGWRCATRVDSLIATTASISAFGFITLWSFGLQPVRELGLTAALGVIWLLLLAVFFLPALDLIIAGPALAPQAREDAMAVTPSWLSRALETLSAGSLRITLWLSQGRKPWGIIGGVCGLFVVVAFLFAGGAIVSRTTALDFIRGTLVEKEARILNQPGNVGFEFLDLLVEPAQGAGINDPRFLARSWELQAALGKLPGGRETTSILSTLHQIARESFKKSLPETGEEIAAAFFLLESHLSPAVQRQLYFPHGVRISVSYATDDSVELGRLCEAILTMARMEFPDLKVSTFNKVPLYPQVDKYVREGKVSNVFAAQIGIAFICGGILWWRNRRLASMRLSPILGGMVMSLPLLFATGMMGLVMWGLGIPLDMSTASIGALTINAATDFSLYLALAYQEALHTHHPIAALREASKREGKVIVADCLLNIACFLPLITSHFLPVRQLGWMMAVMLAACALAALILMAALLPWSLTKVQKEEMYADHTPLVPVYDGVAALPGYGTRSSNCRGDHRTRATTAYHASRVCVGGDEGVPRRRVTPLMFICNGESVGARDSDRVCAA